MQLIDATTDSQQAAVQKSRDEPSRHGRGRHTDHRQKRHQPTPPMPVSSVDERLYRQVETLKGGAQFGVERDPCSIDQRPTLLFDRSPSRLIDARRHELNGPRLRVLSDDSHSALECAQLALQILA